MKRHNPKMLQAVKACGMALSILIFAIFSGCKTAPVAPQVNALDLLDSKSSFFLRIPSDVDSILFENVLSARFKGLSKENAAKVASRIDTVYIGLERTKRGAEFQIAISCNFPKIAINSAFSSKNGWTADSLQLKNSIGKQSNYKIFQNKGLLASFPSIDVACFGRDVPEMVEKYHYLANSMAFEPENQLKGEVYEWLDYENGIHDEEIHFFAARPQSFLTMLTGAQLNYQLRYVRGKMYNDSRNENQYIMQIEFDFKDKRIVPAAKGAISLAFGLTDSEIRRDSETHLTVFNIKIDKKQLYKILSL